MTTPQHQPHRSNCHQAPVTIGGDNREGTHYYVCSECNKPCDRSVTVPEHQLTGSEELDVLIARIGLAYTGELSPDESMRLIEQTKADLTKHLAKARLDENESMLEVAEHEISIGDTCYNHERYNSVPQCAACRRRKMFYTVCLEWRKSIKERVAALEAQLASMEAKDE